MNNSIPEIDFTWLSKFGERQNNNVSREQLINQWIRAADDATSVENKHNRSILSQVVDEPCPIIIVDAIAQKERPKERIEYGLNQLYNNWKVRPHDINEAIKLLNPNQRKSLASYFGANRSTSSETEKSYSKVGKLRRNIAGKKITQAVANAADGIDDRFETWGVGKYERDEFDKMVQVVLNPESKKDSNEWKLITSIDDLIKEQNYEKLVDILQGVSSMNMWDKGKIGAGILWTLAILSGGLLPILASWFLGTRWLRQNKIKSIAKDPKNTILLNWVKAEIAKRINDLSTPNWQRKRLEEVMNALQS
jgi:hypothetical protein